MTPIETPAEARAIWVEALRSGEYEQTGGMLHRRTPKGDSYCCLGVACKLYAERYPDDLMVIGDGGGNAITYRPPDKLGSASVLPENVKFWLGLNQPDGAWDKYGNGTTLASLNDHNTPFEEIADTIDNPPIGLLA